MDVQSIIVALIIAAAATSVGISVWKKMRSFGTKSGCASDCGCSKNHNGVSVR